MQNSTSANTNCTKVSKFNGLTNRLIILLTVILTSLSVNVYAQSSANYAFSTGSNGSLLSDLNSNTIDMSSGTTLIVGPGIDASSGIGVTNIGFDFYFWGTRYSQFSTTDDGLIQLGSTTVSNNAYTISGGTTSAPRLAAFNCDMRTGTTTGKIHYKVFGTAPNRVMVIEYVDMQLFYTSTGQTGTSKFQARLYESTGVIEYVYGNMNVVDVSGVTGVGADGRTAAIGFYTGSATNSFASVAFATHTASITSPYSDNPTIDAAGDITNLTSASDGSRRYYRFTPPASQASPSALNFTAVTSSGLTLNWTAASPTTNVLKYAVYVSSDGGVTYSFVNTVNVGTNTLAVTSLVPGTTYMWKVFSVSEGGLSSTPATGTQATNAAATYTWNGSVSTSYAVGGNWTPTRTTPATTDILIIDGAVTPAPTITAFATQTIGRLALTNNAAAMLQSSAGATLTISGALGTDLDIPSGSSLTLGGTSSIGIAFSGTQTATIAGTLKTSTTGTGTLNFTNCTATISGTLDCSSTTNSYTGTATTTTFTSTGTCIMGSNSLVIPIATWNVASNLNITGIVAATSATNASQNFGNITYNCAGATGTMSLFTSSTVSIQGNLNIQATNSGKLRALTSGTLNIGGNLNISGGTFEVASTSGIINVTGTVNLSGGTLDVTSGSGSATLNVPGTFNQTGGTINATGSSTSNNIVFNGTSNQSVTIGTMGTGPVGFRLNNINGITLTGTMVINNTAALTISNGNIGGSGTVTYSGATSRLIYNSTNNSQVANAIEFPSSGGPASLTINNTNTSPNNVVGIPFNRSLGSGGVLTLTAGFLDNTGNVLTITNTATGGISGGSSSSYVKGAVARTLPASLVTGSTYTFPVGKGSYNPFEMVNPTTNAGGTVLAQAEVFDANSGGTVGSGMASINTSRYWAASLNGATAANFTNSLIKLNDTRGTQDGIAASATQTGAFDHIGGGVSTVATGSITTTAPAVTTLPGYFVMGNVSAPVISNLVITPSGNQCTNAARTVTLTVTPGGGAVTTVSLNYQVNGGSVQSVSMTNTSGNDWTGIIPTVTPSNGTVTWSVKATDANTFQVSQNGTTYKDEPLTGLIATATASATTVCAGSPVVLTAALKASLGAGGTNSSSLGESFLPGSWGGAKTQYIIRASELSAAGLSAGQFTSIAFEPTNSGQTYQGFSVSLAQTSNTTAAFPLINTGLVQVYQGTADANNGFTPVANTVNTLTFGNGGTANSFTWDGISNLVVQICWARVPVASTSSSTTMKVDVTSFTCTAAGQKDSQLPSVVCGYTTSAEFGNTTTTSTRPKFTFTQNPSSITWSDGSNAVGTSNPQTVNPASNATYTGTIITSGCPITTNGIAITVNSLPASPGGNNSTQCGTATPGVFVTTGGGGGGFKWYLVPTGGTAISGQSAATLSSYPVSSTTDFYVAEIGPNGCESPRTQVTATVSSPDPVQASVDNNNPCTNSSIQLTATVSSGTNANSYAYSWSASPASGSGIPTTQPGGTGTFGSPASTSVTPTAPGTYTYTVSGVDNSCTATATVVVTVKALPVITTATANPTTTCAGSNVTLSGTSTVINPVTGTVGTGSLTTENSGNSSTTYNSPFSHWYGGYKAQYIIRASELTAAGLGAGNFTSLAFDVTKAGITYTGFTVSIANTASTVMTSTFLSPTFTQVYSNNLAVSATGINTLTFTTPFTWDGTSNIVIQLCWSNNNGGGSDAGSAEVKYDNTSYVSMAQYHVDSQTPATVCGTSGASGTLSQRPKMIISELLNVNLTNTLNWVWNPGSSVGSTVVVNPVSTTTYTVTATDPLTTCSNTATATVTVNPLPAAPSGSNGTDQCGTGITDASVSSNNVVDPQSPAYFNWYSAPTGGTLLQSGTSTTYNTAISVTTDFYVAEVSANGCEGPRSQVTTIVSDPDPITVNASSATVCLGSSFDLSVAYEPNFNAYATFDLIATGGNASGITGTVSLTPGGNGTEAFSITPTAPGSYTYTVTAIDPDKGCTAINTVEVTVSALPPVNSATATPATICAGANVELKATAGTVAATDITVGAGAITVSGTTTGQGNPYNHYYGGQKTQIIYTKSELNAAGLSGGNITALKLYLSALNSSTLTMSNFTISMGHTTQTTATNTLITSGLTQVYSNAAQGVTVGTNTYTLSTPFNWDNTNNIVISICWSNNNSGSSSSSPTLIADVTAASQVSYIWADATAALALLAASDNTSSGIGTTSQTNNTTNRPKLTFSGQGGTDITANYTWTWNPGNINAGTTGIANVTPGTTTTYTATATDASGCSANSSPVTVTVNPLPAAPATNDPVTRCGPGSVTLTATGSGGSLNWYNVATGGTSLQSGGSYTTNVTVGNISFWVAETSVAGCEGPRTEVHVTATAAPTLVITPSGATTFCAGGNVTLNGATGSASSYTNFNWTINPSTGGGLSAGTGTSVTVEPTIAGAYTVTLTADDGNPITGCSNTTTVVVTMNMNPVISSVTASPTTICAGTTSTLTVQSILGAPGTAQVGTESFTDITPSPYRGGSGSDCRNQMLYTAAELTAAGLTAGPITSISFNNVTSPSSAVNQLTISIGATSATSLSSTFNTSPTTAVWGPVNFIPVLGVNTHIFSTPFVWDGVSSIIVNTCSPGGGGTSYSVSIGGVSGRSIQTATSGACTATTGTSYNQVVAKFGGVLGSDLTNTYNFTWNPGNLSGISVGVAPSSTTTYTVTATNPTTLCTTTGTTTVTVLPVGANASASPATPVCAGTSVTLSAGATGGAPFTYAWASTPTGTYTANANGDITVSPTVTTSYTVTVTDNCGNSTTSSVTVTVNPLPVVSIQEGPGPLTICQPATQTLTAVSNVDGANYQWTLNGNNIGSANNATYVVSVAGTGSYAVLVTNPTTGCSNTSAAVSVTINGQPSAITITPSAPVICNGSSQLLTAGGGTALGSGTTTIGTATTLTGATAQPTAFCNRWPSYRMQSIYTAAELQAAGIGAGPITSMAFNITTLGDAAFNNNFVVKISNTALNSFVGASGFVSTASGFTTVFPAQTYTHAVGLNTITFSTPFIWNGTSNIVIDVQHDGADITNNSQTYYTATAVNMVAYTITSATGSANFSTNRMNVVFGANVVQSPTWTWSPATGLSSTTGASVTASPSESTTYTVTATSAFGCTNTNTVTVNVNPRPTATISGSGAFCQN
ncbi:MAG: fibronectin type III domain-containing protein, partial [Bacteroidetes bacterium]|nr:fibronectin type III domain-containing protein [Bacteroidota bacterium]